jgi:hypothetical protein
MSQTALLDNESYVHILARNMVLDQEYHAILDAFAAADIPVISLKGIALIQKIYADPGERYVGDMDLVVKPEDYDRARVVLDSLDYVSSPAYFDPKIKGCDPFIFHYATSLRSFAFTKKAGVGFYVHLHWHLINSVLPLFMLTVDMDEIWQESIEEQCGDNVVRVLAPHHAVLFLALHAFKHSYNKMSLFTDLQKTLEHYADQLDWDRVLVSALQWNAATPLYYSLKITSEIVSLAIPEGIMETITPKKESRLVAEVLTRVQEERLATDNLVYSLWLDMVHGVWAKLRFIFLSFFPSPRQMSQMYGVKLTPFIFLRYFQRLSRIKS